MRKQIILMTGCEHALGRHTAEALAKRGHWVFATMLDCFGTGVRAARHLQSTAVMKGLDLDVLQMDTTEEASVDRAIGSVLERAGEIDAVIHSGGLGATGLAEGFTVEQMRSVFEVNVFGVQRVNRAVLPGMREREQGLLLHVSSVLGRFAMPNLSVFDASLFALEALAEAYSYELSSVGVDSIIVEPGPFAADLELNSVRAEDTERISQYGTNADLGERISEHEGLSLGPASPELQEVVDTIVQLLETSAGSRPLRTVIDRESGDAIAHLNDTSAGMSERILTAMGHEDLLRPRH